MIVLFILQQMVFYIEACESGSMFYKKLKKNINGMSADNCVLFCYHIYKVSCSIIKFVIKLGKGHCKE